MHIFFIISILISIASILVKPVFKLLKFTGIILAIVVLFVIDNVIVPFALGEKMTMKAFPSIYPIYEKVIISFLLILIFLTTLKNIIKLFFPNFNYKNIFFKSKVNVDISNIEKVEFSCIKNK